MRLSTPSGTRSKVACWAPHSSLYFRPDGFVQACCATGFSIGTVHGVDRSSLREIWEGAALESQRSALEVGSFEYGCEECEFIASAAGREASLASHFDRFAPGAPHHYPKLFDFALSTRCNLQCVMCNGELSSAIRTQREGRAPMPNAYDDRFFAELEEFLPHAQRMQFKGGEPFLAPENQRIWDFVLAEGLRPEVTITTNGTIETPAVEHYVRALHAHPIVSVDAMDSELLSSIRVGTDPRIVWRNVDRLQRIVEQTGVGMTLSFCLMSTNWWELGPFLAEVDRRGLNPNVILVNQPHEFDLLRRPIGELELVLDRLERHRPDFINDAASGEWGVTLQRVRSQIESPVELVVSDGPPVQVPRVDRTRLTAELRAAHRCAPVVIEAADGAVQEVEVPDWAKWLRAHEWTGTSMDELGALLAQRFDHLSSEPVRSETPGVSAYQVDLAAGTNSVRLTAYVFLDADTEEPVALAYRS